MCVFIYSVCITNEEINAAEISEEFMFTSDRNLKACVSVSTIEAVIIIIAQWLVSQQITSVSAEL